MAEIFVLLSEDSTKSVPLYMKMIDTEQECAFDRPYLDTGYLSCYPPIEGSKLHISLLTSQTEPQVVSIAGLNIYSSYNLITQPASPLTVEAEGTWGIHFFNTDFQRSSAPRKIQNDDRCLIYSKNPEFDDFEALTFDLGK